MRIFNNTANDADRLYRRAAEVGVSLRAVPALPALAVPAATAHFNIAAVPSLAGQADAIVHAVAATCESDYLRLTALFGIAPPPSFTITLANLSKMVDGTGGAYHMTCDATDLYCDVQLTPTVDADRSRALAVAEMVEVWEDKDGKGWDCGATNGEGLSRVLADELYPGTLDDYSVAANWLDSIRNDWVNNNNPTDTDPVSNGCAVLFLNWLRWDLKFPWTAICQSGAANLNGTYRQLTHTSEDGFPPFADAMVARFPPGPPSRLKSDNPFRPRS